MFTSLRLPVLLACCLLVLAQDQPMINTPQSLGQCLPSMLTFSGGTPPYSITVIPAGQTSAAPLSDLGQTSSNNMTWIADQPSGTQVTLQIRDSKGLINYSQAQPIQASNINTCLKSGGANTATTSSNGSASPAGAANSNTASKTSPTNSTGTTSSSKETTSTSSSPSNNTKGPSPFVSSSNSTTASGAKAGSAAPGCTISYPSFVAGLAVVGGSLAFLA